MKKKILYIILFLILFLFISFIIYSEYSEKNFIYILINNTEIWEKNTKTWKKVNKNKIKKYESEKVNLFIDSQYRGMAYYTYGIEDNINLYDEKFNKITPTDNLVIIKSNNKYSNGNVVETNDLKTDENIISVLEKYSLPTSQNLDINKYKVDINNDGESDYLYGISNFFKENENCDKYFSIIFSVINEQIEIIESKIVDSNKQLEANVKYLKSIIDVDKDGDYELIILNTAYSQPNTYCMKKYNTKNATFENLIDCED